MKALTVWEPWATLLALNVKKIETRGWKTKYRGPVAIHAAARMPKEAKAACRMAADSLNVLSYRDSVWCELENGNGNFGCIIAVADLADCLEITDLQMDKTNQQIDTAILEAGGRYLEVKGRELAFGDYRPGRFGWILDNIHRLEKPVPAKGRQGLWNWDHPDYIEIDPYKIGEGQIMTSSGQIISGEILEPGTECKDKVCGLRYKVSF